MSVESREKHPGRVWDDIRWILDGNRVPGDERYLESLHAGVGEELQFALTVSGTVFARGKRSLFSIADEEVIATATTVIQEDLSFVVPDELMRAFDAQPKDCFMLYYRKDNRVSVVIAPGGHTPEMARKIEEGRRVRLVELQAMTTLEEMGVATVDVFGLPSPYPTAAQIQQQIAAYSKPRILTIQRHPRVIPTLAAWTGGKETGSHPIEFEAQQPEGIDTGNLVQETLFDVPITGPGRKIPKRR